MTKSSSDRYVKPDPLGTVWVCPHGTYDRESKFVRHLITVHKLPLVAGVFEDERRAIADKRPILG